jgi:hypothetical protein
VIQLFGWTLRQWQEAAEFLGQPAIAPADFVEAVAAACPGSNAHGALKRFSQLQAAWYERRVYAPGGSPILIEDL